MEQLRAATKWLLSFRKSTWEFEDYPIRYRVQDDGQHRVQFINWWTMVGLGISKEDAEHDLRERLARFYRENNPIHRPGSKAPLQFADSSRIDAHGDFAYELVNDLFNRDVMFISDGTPLDIYADDENQYAMVIQIVNDRYGLGLAPDEDISVDELVERIVWRR